MRNIVSKTEAKTAYLGKNALGDEELPFIMTIEESGKSTKERIRTQDARKKLRQFIECEKNLQKYPKNRTEWRLARREQLGIMSSFFAEASFCMNCCDRFILIEQLLIKEEKLQKNHRRNKKEGFSKGIEMAKDLLHNPLSTTVILHAPLSINSLTFVEEMIHNAEMLCASAVGSVMLLDAAMQLADIFNKLKQNLLQELHHIYSKHEGQIGGRKILSIWQDISQEPELVHLFRRLEGQWFIFTALWLKHKLYRLMKINPTEIEVMLNASIPYEGCGCRLALENSFAGMSS